MRSRLSMAALVAVLALLLTGCGVSVPADPHGTLDRAENGTLRVGVTENAPWVELDGGRAEPTGSEPELISAFAEEHDATIDWTEGSEAVLMSALERGELDIVIGGFLDDTPWIDKAAATRPYTESEGPDGPEKHVVLARMGENALLVALEEFLDEASRS
ncbi:transporter substrate-binding domain-containing protein [Microbacterium sp. 179-I 3D4 NHS]|uniref:transporter substrate-binding domain-containing protein n=1 Tax=Microbacterium sp. 179-I 3D4 NHS TaxID=3142381 RepID=UPI0039A2F833